MESVDYTIPGTWCRSKNTLDGVEMDSQGVVRNAAGYEVAFYSGKRVAWEHLGYKFSKDEVNKALDFWIGRCRVGGNEQPKWFLDLLEKK